MWNCSKILFIFLIIFLITGCYNSTEPDKTPPNVIITYPIDGSIVSEIVTITAMATDNDGIEKVSLWVDGKPIEGSEDTSEPYELKWNTVTYEDGSSHTIVIRAFDKSGNKSDSDQITLIVNNVNSRPTQINLNPIIYENSSFILTWPPSKDEDFRSYILYEALSEDMNNESGIFTTNNKNDTTFTVTNITENVVRYYRLIVEDTLGLKTESNICKGSSIILVAYYPFNGNANDESINENHGEIYGASLTEDKFGHKNSAYFFDGLDDYILIMDNDLLTPVDQQLTVAVWAKLHYPGNKYLLYKGSTRYNREYALGIRSDSLASFQINNQGGWDYNQHGVPSETKLEEGVWYYIVGTWDGNFCKIYINGQLENTTTPIARIGNFDSDLYIGSYGGNISMYAIKGVIDEVMIFNKALSDREIYELYNSSKF